jgi:hypothetical protein
LIEREISFQIITVNSNELAAILSAAKQITIISARTIIPSMVTISRGVPPLADVRYGIRCEVEFANVVSAATVTLAPLAVRCRRA